VLDAASAAPLRQAPEFATWAGRVDLLLANEEEIEVLGGGHGAREVVVKRGAAGASWNDASRTVDLPAEPADARDTTGAGDAFAAGFLSAWPGRPESALERGLALAALAVTRPGGRP
jgi:ribokinase